MDQARFCKACQSERNCLVLMVISSDPQPKPSAALLAYLQGKLGLSASAINLGLRQAELEQAPLPVVLWSFGLLSLQGYQDVLDWQQAQE